MKPLDEWKPVWLMVLLLEERAMHRLRLEQLPASEERLVSAELVFPA